MKQLLYLLLLTLAVPSLSSAQSLKVKATGSKSVTISDKVGKNQFSWSSTAPVENIDGTAEGVKGAFTFDPTNVSKLTGWVSAEIATFKSGNDMRDEHIQGATWLDAAKHPVVRFDIASLKNVKVDGNKVVAVAVGQFSMHGVSRQLEIPFTLHYLDQSAATKKRAAGDLVSINASFDIALKEFNVEGSAGTIGSKVGEKIKITANLFGSTAK